MTNVKEVLRMTGGTGSDSYARNSNIQKRGVAFSKVMVKEAMIQLLTSIPCIKSLTIADLGYSSGANTFNILSEIIDVIVERSDQLGREPPEIQLLLNDLPSNDFNTLLGPNLSLRKEKLIEAKAEKFLPFFTAVVSGSFYERLFCESSVHFVYSSYCIHWLSNVPKDLKSETEGALNKRNIYISETSPPIVSAIYLEQFQNDFTMFLKHRSKEMHNHGHMVLLLVGKKCSDPSKAATVFWKWLAEALNGMVLKGAIKASDIDALNMPFYVPSMEEVKMIVKNEGSFDLFQDTIYETTYHDDFGLAFGEHGENGKKVSRNCRAIIGPLLESFFGEAKVDELFVDFAKIASKALQQEEECQHITFAISLRKKVKSK
ncbi:hypothetical protein LUZ60_017671 [Juncus effusus]|nr:hypothetical protein LUZ60_017671 [Juncus effusus]